MQSSTDIAVIIGAFVTVVGGFLAVAKIMLAAATKEREADRLERVELSKAIERMAQASADVATATVKSAKEAKQRNGHLADQTVKLGEMGERQARLTRKIISRLEKTAVIAAEDRSILINKANGRKMKK